MKVVVDTNVLVSGLLSPFNAPGEIVRMTSAGLLKLCYNALILSEYEEILARPKFGFDSSHVEILIEQIKACGFKTMAKPLNISLPDPDDLPFLEVAVTAQADCLITGNLKHYPISKRQHMNVLRPSDFIDFYRRQ